MKISKLMEILEEIQYMHGDLLVQVYTSNFVRERGVYKREWHGTVQSATIDSRNEENAHVTIVTTN